MKFLIPSKIFSQKHTNIKRGKWRHEEKRNGKNTPLFVPSNVLNKCSSKLLERILNRRLAPRPPDDVTFEKMSVELIPRSRPL